MLAVGVDCTVTVTFSPGFIGLSGGLVLVTDDALGAVQTSGLEGKGQVKSVPVDGSNSGSRFRLACLSQVRSDAVAEKYLVSATDVRRETQKFQGGVCELFWYTVVAILCGRFFLGCGGVEPIPRHLCN